MSEKELNLLLDVKISGLLKAAKDYQNNPDKAKDYIITTVINISKASRKLGEMSITDELFG